MVVDGRDYNTVRLVTNTEVELARGELMKLRFKEFFSKGWVITLLIIILVLGTAYIILVTRYRKLRKKHLQERRRAEQRRRLAAQERAAREAAMDAFDTDWSDIP